MKAFNLSDINLTKYLFFTGKGGVGKTSIACATAVGLADQGKKILLISTDPASNLQDVFNQTLNGHGTTIPDVPQLTVVNLNPEQAAAEYRESVIAPFKGKLPESVIQNMEEQLSGSCTVEIAAFNQFSDFITDMDKAREYDFIIFDTAPTGHTLRMLQLPSAWSTFISESTHGASCLGQLSGLEERKEIYKKAVETLADSSATRLVLVSRPEQAPLKEAARSSQELASLGINNQVLVINGILQQWDETDSISVQLHDRQERAMANIPDTLSNFPTYSVPLRSYNLSNVASIRQMLHSDGLHGDINYQSSTEKETGTATGAAKGTGIAKGTETIKATATAIGTTTATETGTETSKGTGAAIGTGTAKATVTETGTGIAKGTNTATGAEATTGAETAVGAETRIGAAIRIATEAAGKSVDELVNDLYTSGKRVVFTMGKGGVGKTTLATEIALKLKKLGANVHLTTTDPANHLNYQLAIQSGITVSHIDEAEELEKYKNEVRSKAAEAMTAEDMEYIEEDLRSPCTQEIAVFKAFARIVDKAKDEIVVIDTAPTGHTLLLLDATQSYHKEIERAQGEVTGEVADLLPRLRNPKETEVVIVTLPEATPVFEAERLQMDLKRAGINNKWWVVNACLSLTDTDNSFLRAKAHNELPWIEKVEQLSNGNTALIGWQNIS